MDQIYVMARETAAYGTAIAAIVAGFKIYTKWNRGEPVIGLIFTWVINMIIAATLMIMIWSLILSKGVSGYDFIPSAMQMAKEMHSAAIVMGVCIAIIGVIDIYRRHNSGDDVTELVYRWVASLFFLFTFGLIIEAII